MTTRGSEGDETRRRALQYLERQGLTEGARIVPLTGDASDRRYFRLLRPNAPSVVLAVHAAPFDPATLPFLNVARLLRAMPVPVPDVIGHAGDLGVLALEDLGDLTLQAHLGVAPAAGHAALYRQAVDLIAVLQRRGRELVSPDHLPYGIAFDEEKLRWELDFFLRHFLEGYRGLVLPATIREAFADEFRLIAAELAAEPRVLCHRDYHSRNLMLHKGRLYLIDFQDARMGPDTYDLVSLLRDSYVDLCEDEVNRWIEHFRSVARLQGEPATFRHRFERMALQRNLKALGTFGYQTAVRGNAVYIQYIPRTLHYVAENLRRPAFDGRLRELLTGCLEELR